MRYYLICLLFILTSFTADQPFPVLVNVRTLEGKDLNLPADLKGKFSLIGIAYSLKAQNDLETWLQPLYNAFAQNDMFNINLYLMMVTGNLPMTQENVLKKLKANIDKELYKYVINNPQRPAQLIEMLSTPDKEVPWFIVVDPRGQITYKTSGKFSRAKLEEIADKLSE
jgi:hypothetical protein